MKNRLIIGGSFLFGYFLFFILLFYFGLDSANYLDARIYICVFGVLEAISIVTIYNKHKLIFFIFYVLNCILSSFILMLVVYIRNQIPLGINFFKDMPPFLLLIMLPLLNTSIGIIFIYFIKKLNK